MSQLPDLPPIPELPVEQSSSRELPVEQLSAAPNIRQSDIQLPEIPRITASDIQLPEVPRITAGAIESGDNRPLDEKIDELLTIIRELRDKLESGEYFKLG